MASYGLSAAVPRRDRVLALGHEFASLIVVVGEAFGRDRHRKRDMALRLGQLGVFRVLDVCLPAKTLGHISAQIGLLLGVASLVGSPRRSSVVVGNARLSRLLALGCGFRLIIGLVAVDLDALRGGGKVSGALELGIAADLDRRPPIFLREPDQIGEGVADRKSTRLKYSH